jgi:hypothetical protein
VVAGVPKNRKGPHQRTPDQPGCAASGTGSLAEDWPEVMATR